MLKLTRKFLKKPWRFSAFELQDVCEHIIPRDIDKLQKLKSNVKLIIEVSKYITINHKCGILVKHMVIQVLTLNIILKILILSYLLMYILSIYFISKYTFFGLSFNFEKYCISVLALNNHRINMCSQSFIINL